MSFPKQNEIKNGDEERNFVNSDNGIYWKKKKQTMK